MPGWLGGLVGSGSTRRNWQDNLCAVSRPTCTRYARKLPQVASNEELSIGCHLDWHELRGMAVRPRRPWIVVLVREPAARVWSEYRMCVATSACREQLQWDHLRLAPLLARREHATCCQQLVSDDDVKLVHIALEPT